MANFGLKIVQRLYNVLTALKKNILLNSSEPSLKFYKTGVVSISIPANTATNTKFSATVEYDLPYIPMVLVYPNDGTYAASLTTRQINYNNTQAADTNLINNIDCYMDITHNSIKFWINCTNTGANTPAFWGSNPAYQVNIKYYIFSQSLE